MINVIKAVYGNSKYFRTARRFQWDKGQKLVFDGVALPNAYRVDFSTDPQSGTSISQLGTSEGVNIPNSLFEAGKNIYAWIVLSEGAEDERTVLVAEIPVSPRPKPNEYEPTEEETTLIQQAIDALNKASSRRVYVDENDYLRFEEGGNV